MATTKIVYKTPQAIQDEAGRRINRVFDELAGMTFAIQMNRKHIGPREMEQIERAVEAKDFRMIGLDILVCCPLNFN